MKTPPQQVIREYPPTSSARRPTLSIATHCRGKEPSLSGRAPAGSGQSPQEEAGVGWWGGAEAVIASHDEDIINFPEDLGHPTSFSFLISKGGVKAW